MKFTIVGLSHHTASIELRERFAQETQPLGPLLARLRAIPSVEEACVLCTCNRFELYIAGSEEPRLLGRRLKRYLESVARLPPQDLEPHLYQRSGAEGIRHLFRVASSLDSMVLGEPQILGQVKESYQAATQHQAVGPVIDRVFQKAFFVAKRIRTETGIAENAVSMSFAAVELGKEIFHSLEGKEVLLIGAGKMATLAAKHLGAYGVSKVRVASRSLATAERLAKEIGGAASSLSDLPMLLNGADIVISSTAAPGYIVDRKMMARVIRKRRYRSILFVDIAVPRDIDPLVSQLDNVFVYDVDDLKSVLELNREARAKEAASAEGLIQEELLGFLRWSKSQEVVPVIKALRRYATDIAEREAERTVGGLRSPDPKARQRVILMAQSIVNKVFHPVLNELKREGRDGDPGPLIDALVQLFPIEPDHSTQTLDTRDLDSPEPPEADKVVPLVQSADKK